MKFQFQPVRAAVAFAMVLAGAGCIADVGSDELDATDAAAQTAMAQLLAKAKTEAFVDLPQKPSDALLAATEDAAKRGVRVYAWLKAGDYDTTLMRDFRMGLADVDVDVVTGDPLAGNYLVSDGTALGLEQGKVAKHTDAATVQKLRGRFLELFQPPAPAHKNQGLIGSGQLALLPMPESGPQRILDVFAAAKSSIDLEIYWLQDRSVIQALKDADKRGVNVRVMLEPKVVGGGNFKNLSVELDKSGIAVSATPPEFDSHNNVDHAKFAIVDGKELLVGSGNLMRAGIGSNTDDRFDYRDFWVEDGRPKSVAEAQAIFDADWQRKSTSGTDLANLVATPDNAADEVSALIDSAKKRLYVYNQSITSSDVIARLVAAKKRGVDVRVLLGYQPIPHAPPPNQDALDQLRKAGATAAFLKRHYLHGKAIVADDKVFIGSQNFTGGGLGKNRELGLIVADSKVVATVVATFQADSAHPE